MENKYYITGDGYLKEGETGIYQVLASAGSDPIHNVNWVYDNSKFQVDGGSVISSLIYLKAMPGSTGYSKISATILDINLKTHYVSFNVVVSTESGTMPPSEPLKITGPTEIFSDEAVLYHIGRIDSDNKLKWSFDSNIFTLIKRYDYTGTIALIPRLSDGKVSATISCSLKSESAKIDVVVKAKPRITTSSQTACPDSQITYSVINSENLPSPTITWQAISNAVLVSGQGTANATFKATANGYIDVKATIKYSGGEIILENSDVWVGSPSMGNILPSLSNPGISIFEQGQYYEFTVIARGSERIDWSVSGYAIITQNNNHDIKIMITSLNGRNGDGLFTITAKAYNSCGSSSEKSFTGIVKNRNNGGVPQQPIPQQPIPQLP